MKKIEPIKKFNASMENQDTAFGRLIASMMNRVDELIASHNALQEQVQGILGTSVTPTSRSSEPASTSTPTQETEKCNCHYQCGCDKGECNCYFIGMDNAIGNGIRNIVDREISEEKHKKLKLYIKSLLTQREEAVRKDILEKIKYMLTNNKVSINLTGKEFFYVSMNNIEAIIERLQGGGK